MKVTVTKNKYYNLITFENSAGMTVCLTDLGAAIREVKVPDKNGEVKTVTLCPTDDKIFVAGYHGKTIGRTSGRINGATFSIDGKTAVLEKNNYGRDNLHGGATGLHAQKFSYIINEGEKYTEAEFTYLSKDGEGGYFGNVKITVIYRIYEGQNRFGIIFKGVADEKTLLNLTNHVYWNMGGNLTENVKEQALFINASHVGKLNERLISEEIIAVPAEFDFRKPHKIGDFAEAENVQRHTTGYDHPFFFAESGLDKLACALQSEKSGIRLEVRTTYPCVVLYTDNYADGNVEVYKDRLDEKYMAACLECQYHPDGVHQTPEKCGIISPENDYYEEVDYRFVIA